MSIVAEIEQMEEPECDHSHQEEEYDGLVYLGTRCERCGVFFPRCEDYD